MNEHTNDVMPGPNDATVSLLLDELRRDPERSYAAWQEVREILRAHPERMAARLCRVVDQSLEAGEDLQVKESIIVVLEACTKGQAELVPADILRRLLSRVDQFDDLSALCLAAMLVRLRPEGIITEGVQDVLVATERALVEPDDDSSSEVQRYAKKIAFDLWSTVAARDPASLVALLEFWAAQVGWQRHSSHLLAELLLETAPHHPSIINDSIAVLEVIGDKYDDPEGELESPDRILDELKKVREKLQRKAIAEELAAELTPTESYTRPPRPPESQDAEPDPAVDRLIENFLSGDPEREFKAKDQFGRKMRNPSPALIEGVREAADELFVSDPRDERFELLLYFLYFATDGRPEFVPTESLQSWSRSNMLKDVDLTLIYSILARVRPDWIVENSLPRALGAAVTSSGALASTFLAGLGVAYPGLVVQFASRWLDRVGWDMDFGTDIASAFEQIAQERPEKIDTMVDLLDAQKSEPEPGVIDLRFQEISPYVERLEQIREGNNP
jgi:hypothetical protein